VKRMPRAAGLLIWMLSLSDVHRIARQAIRALPQQVLRREPTLQCPAARRRLVPFAWPCQPPEPTPEVEHRPPACRRSRPRKPEPLGLVGPVLALLEMTSSRWQAGYRAATRPDLLNSTTRFSHYYTDGLAAVPIDSGGLFLASQPSGSQGTRIKDARARPIGPAGR